MRALPIDDLRSVCGGMKLDGFRRSTNIEDRRHLTPWQSMHVRSPLPPPIKLPPRFPGDLPSQAGIDDIGKHLRRR